jgi:phage-related protein
MPVSRPMPSIGPRCHELRIKEESHTWRIIYRADVDVVLILDVFDKNQSKTPRKVIENCKRILSRYDKLRAGSK